MPLQELDPSDLEPDLDERSTSHTRRMGSNAQAALEIELRKSRPDTPPANAPSALIPSEGAVPVESLPKPYLAGDVIAGKYRLTRIIGRGGMGAVWQAHNLPLDIDVAIKLIRRDRTAPGAAERLLTEARAAARLMHPAIVRVFDFGESEQRDPFIVMELLHGESLSAILRRKKRLTPAVAVQTMLPVASALASAHGKGIVHRDLKPDNIIVVASENGGLIPKIVDFGIAKLLSADIDRAVTLAGEVLGSPDYMSPEQARGAENVGEATDIWAFSVVLYELLTGTRPFDGPNYNALIASILTNDAPTITARGVPDPALAAIIAQGLAKDVAERWPRIRDVGVALAHWAVEAGIEDDVAGNPIAKQWLAGAAKRLLTVQPEVVEAAFGRFPPAGPPPVTSAPPGPPPPVVETIVGKRRSSAPRLVWIAPAVAIAGVLGTAAWLGSARLATLVAGAPAVTAVTAASAPDPTVTAAPTASAAPTSSPNDATPAASGSPEAPAASASAIPAGSGRLPWPKPPRKNVAPRAPKHIKF